MATMTDAEERRRRTDTISPPDDEELAELMDPENWDWDNVLIGVPSPNPTLTIGIRLDAEESRLLGDAARAANMPMTRYIKRVALEAARRVRKAAPSQDTTKGAA
jgi:hypothetical protein